MTTEKSIFMITQEIIVMFENYGHGKREWDGVKNHLIFQKVETSRTPAPELGIQYSSHHCVKTLIFLPFKQTAWKGIWQENQKYATSASGNLGEYIFSST